MSEYCKYHPKESAAWFCENCETLFCNTCVPEDTENYFPKCTLCRRSLRSLSVAERIPPFWQKLSSLLTIPFSQGSLFFIFLFGMLFSILPQGKVGLALTACLLLPVIELIFDAMEKTASGDKPDSGITENLKLKVHSQSVKLLLGFGLATVVLTKIYAINSSIGLLLSIFVVLGIPASLIILMMEKSVIAMFNPLKIGFIIKQFKSAYFLLYGLMLAITFTTIKMTAYSLSASPGLLAEILGYSLVLYLIITVAILAGYLVYQYHHELNFTINRQTLHQNELSAEKDEMAEVNIFIQEGRYEDAQKLLLDKINRNPADYRANEKLILLYAVQGKDAYIKQIANQYFDTMVEQRKHKQAVDFYQKLYSKSIEFTPESMDVVIALTREMKNKSQFKIALTLIEKYLSENKASQNWERLFLIKAQLLVEYANRSADAVPVLKHIINRSIDQELMQKAEDYLKAVQ